MQNSSQNITTNKPTPSFLQAGCTAFHPTNSVKAPNGKSIIYQSIRKFTYIPSCRESVTITTRMIAICLQSLTYHLTLTNSSHSSALQTCPFSALTLLVVRQEGHLACKKTGCWFVGGDDLTGALHIL